MKLIVSTLVTLICATAMLAGTIPGGYATNCIDPTAFVLVPGTNYYNNPTCPIGEDRKVEEEEEVEEVADTE